MKASCTGSGCSREPRPSSVIMSRPTQPSTGITQARAATPSISTAQAPHSPSPQPYFGPFNSRSLRKTWSNAVSGAASTSWILPLTVRRIVLMLLSPGCAAKCRAKLFGKIPFVYKRASGAFGDAARCLLYEQRREANEFLCGNGGFSPSGPLDRVSVRAQNHSYTNKMIGPRKRGYDRRLLTSRLVHGE